MTPTPSTAPDATALLRVHARLRGRGRVYDGAQVVAEVTYRLFDVEEPAHTVVGDGASGATTGERDIYGRLETSDAVVLGAYIRVRLALRLDDGRQLPFTVTRVTGARALLVHALGPIE